MLKETGILLLAIGHPYYGRMAYNLAMSIKAVDKTVDITLVYTESAVTHINSRNMWVFDNKMLIDPSEHPFGVKLMLDQLTPYERTLYIDADTLWVNKKSPEKIFEQLKGVSFTGITEGMHNYDSPAESDHSKYYFFWADLKEIEQEYNAVGKIYQWRSEFIYFEKCKLTEQLFGIARNVYEVNATGYCKNDNHKRLKEIKKFADHIPDELAFNIAANICGVHPHKYKWKPTYWDRLNGDAMPDIEDLLTNYYVISCGSNASGGALKRVYNRIAAASAYRLRLQHVFPLISKKEMLMNRQLM